MSNVIRKLVVFDNTPEIKPKNTEKEKVEFSIQQDIRQMTIGTPATVFRRLLLEYSRFYSRKRERLTEEQEQTFIRLFIAKFILVLDKVEVQEAIMKGRPLATVLRVKPGTPFADVLNRFGKVYRKANRMKKRVGYLPKTIQETLMAHYKELIQAISDKKMFKPDLQDRGVSDEPIGEEGGSDD